MLAALIRYACVDDKALSELFFTNEDEAVHRVVNRMQGTWYKKFQETCYAGNTRFSKEYND